MLATLLPICCRIMNIFSTNNINSTKNINNKKSEKRLKQIIQIITNSTDNNIATTSCGSGKKYKMCCGK